jgi:hypothetical protein
MPLTADGAGTAQLRDGPSNVSNQTSLDALHMFNK